MSNPEINEKIEPVEDEVLDAGQAQGPRKSGLSPAAKLGLILGGGVIAVGLAMAMTGPGEDAQTQLNRPPRLDATPGGSNQASSMDYQESVRQENERRAALAAQLGVTSMPTPEVILQPVQQIRPVPEIPQADRREIPPPPAAQVQPVSRRIMPQPEPAPQPVRQPEVQVAAEVTNAPATSSGNAQDEPNRFTDEMLKQMGMIAQRQAPIGLRNDTVSRASNENAVASPANGGGASSGAEIEEARVVLRPGDILYAETLTSVSSDAQAPVLVEVVAGEYRGSRLVGTFTADRRADAMVVNFTNMTFADGASVAVNAFAVDGRSAETAVASDVERRYLQRYGPVLAATFISSFAQSQSQPDRVVTGTGQDRDVTLRAPTLRQSAFAGLGAATDVIARDIMQSAPVGARINLRAGFPVAILIVEPVTIAASPAQTN